MNATKILVWLLVTAGLAALVAKEYPSMARYIKIAKM